ncbi:hypothetical protein KG892_00715 [Vermiphilus pyriformis]|nr:MAG: hypothetical protein KG892_00715 [Vermiphilus pyriformis]
MSDHRSIIRYFSPIILACSVGITTYAAPGLPNQIGAPSFGPALGNPNAGMPGAIPGLSPEEMEIMKLVNDMSPDQQAQLWDEIMNDISKMPQDAQDKFWQDLEKELGRFGSILGAPANTPATPEPVAPAPQPAPRPAAPVTPSPKPVVTPDQEISLEQGAKIIKSILSHIESFLLKAQIIPDISERMDRWASKKAFPNWSKVKDWQQLSTAISELMVRLNKIIDRDPRTKEYRHLQQIIGQENLYNNLKQLNSKLISNEPGIQVPKVGETKLSSDSRRSIKIVTNALIDAITTTNLTSELDKALQLFDPTAQNLRKQEEAYEQKARESMRTTRPNEPIISVGKPHDDFWSNFTGTANAGQSAYNDSRFNNPTPSTLPAYEPEPRQKPEEGLKSAASGSSSDKKSEEKKEEKKEEVKDTIAETAIKSFNEAIDAAHLAIEDSKLSYLNKYMKGNQQIDTSLGNTISSVRSNIRKATQQVKKLRNHLKNLSDAAQKKFKSEVKSIYSADRDIFKDLLANLTDTERSLSTISTDKRFVFWGQPLDALPTDNQKAADELRAQAASAGNPNLETLLSATRELINQMESF